MPYASLQRSGGGGGEGRGSDRRKGREEGG